MAIPSEESRVLGLARRMLRSEEWREWEGERMSGVLPMVTLLIAADPEEGDVVRYRDFYERVVGLTPPQERYRSIRTLGDTMAKAPFDPLVYLPIVAVEQDARLAALAAVEFVCCMGCRNGMNEGMRVLDEEIRAGRIANPGGVFGGLVSLGEGSLHPVLTGWRECLTWEQAGEASMIHLADLQHQSLSFWLDWAEKLVSGESSYEQRILGACTGAMVAALRDSDEDRVSEVVREFPSHGREMTVRETRSWTRAEYAAYAAPRLYRLEEEESAPKLFSAVLREWGLKPAAKASEQFRLKKKARKESTQ